MCGRFAQEFASPLLEKHFSLNAPVDFKPRYNIAPTQSILTLINTDEGLLPCPMRWGLVPRWAKDMKLSAKMINARAETVHEKPAFRAAFKKRRCLIPASGFYEWKQERGIKQPYYITNKEELLAFAGIWETWVGSNDEIIESCAILTTEPDDFMKKIHFRMPVILGPDDYAPWLASSSGADSLRQLLAPRPMMGLTAHPVSLLVNNPGYDLPQCKSPIVES